MTVTTDPPKETVSQLTKDETDELRKQERIIAKGFIHMRSCADALRVVRDGKLYRAKFKTFAEYCEKTWGKNRDTVDLMLQTWEFRKEIAENFGKEKPLQTLIENAPEDAVRKLDKVPPRSRRRVLKAAEKNGALTARVVEENAPSTRRRGRGKSDKAEPKDPIGPRQIASGPQHEPPCAGFVSQETVVNRMVNAYGGNGQIAKAEPPAVQEEKPQVEVSDLVSKRDILTAFDVEVADRTEDWCEEKSIDKAVAKAVKCLRKVLEAL